jgi:hypothetical protein
MIGLMILRGIFSGYWEPLTEMWNPATGRDVFNATMSRNNAFSESAETAPI